ncbi:uncharacterized protein EI90DRAFT_3047068 [Cantharellus anzutake]|uniref:uncharacterized protein n=1 Tax=Cantharellus anzutake TaxID=1750568 RepID=UPI0019042CE7|nr:uncharacterized protein EI90DRAFT_3047068 [Cantharellus anzutake]KAF8335766.1 hypothetical protein EI90DRAFT_3047068 [Cantharellus anzutake]
MFGVEVYLSVCQVAFLGPVWAAGTQGTELQRQSIVAGDRLSDEMSHMERFWTKRIMIAAQPARKLFENSCNFMLRRYKNPHASGYDNTI